MPKETGVSYRTVLRTLKPLESQGFIKLVRIEPSKKGGKESKIYSLTLKGSLKQTMDFITRLKKQTNLLRKKFSLTNSKTSYVF